MRRQPLKADPVKARAWQERSATAYQQRRRDATKGSALSARKPLRRNKSRQVKDRRDDSEWRAACVATRGGYCRACGPTAPQTGLECDHVMPRAQGGPSVVENGLLLCPAHHAAKTASRLRIDPAWLDPDQVDWLAAAGWVRFDPATGEPLGRGRNHFSQRGNS